MLVLSRKAGEQVKIGDDVTVTLTKISGNRVAIGIEAPREVDICRGELIVGSDQESSQLAVVKMADGHGPLSSFVAG